LEQQAQLEQSGLQDHKEQQELRVLQGLLVQLARLGLSGLPDHKDYRDLIRRTTIADG
jgi:hypothetical protein